MLQIEIHAPALEKEVNALIDVGLYADSQALLTDALEKLVTTKKESRLDAAILLYQHDEVTLSRAAELAGIHRFEFEAGLEAKGISKTVEVEEALQTGVSRIKRQQKSNDNTNGV
ncbi:MAG: UPF0175 family protein [Gemmatimonadetes bacterium]|nr:UPF0175 family protein [Gemmatimonadota bacterium]